MYLVHKGEFELTKDVPMKEAFKAFLKKGPSRVDLGQKLTLFKQTNLKRDASLSKVRVVLLGEGEVFGFEDC